RQRERLERAAAVEDDAIWVYRMQPRASADRIAYGVHLRLLRGLADDRETFLRIVACKNSRQHQIELGLSHRAGDRRCTLRGAEQLCVDDRLDIDAFGARCDCRRSLNRAGMRVWGRFEQQP